MLESVGTLYYNLSCNLLCIQTVLVELSLKVHCTSVPHAHLSVSLGATICTPLHEWNTWGSDHQSAQVKTKEVPARKMCFKSHIALMQVSSSFQGRFSRYRPYLVQVHHGHVLPKKSTESSTKCIYKPCFGVYHHFTIQYNTYCTTY